MSAQHSLFHGAGQRHTAGREGGREEGREGGERAGQRHAAGREGRREGGRYAENVHGRIR